MSGMCSNLLLLNRRIQESPFTKYRLKRIWLPLTAYGMLYGFASDVMGISGGLWTYSIPYFWIPFWFLFMFSSIIIIEVLEWFWYNGLFKKGTRNAPILKEFIIPIDYYLTGMYGGAFENYVIYSGILVYTGIAPASPMILVLLWGFSNVALFTLIREICPEFHIERAKKSIITAVLTLILLFILVAGYAIERSSWALLQAFIIITALRFLSMRNRHKEYKNYLTLAFLLLSLAFVVGEIVLILT